MLGNELLQGEKVYLSRPTNDDMRMFAEWSNDIEYYRLLRRGMVYPDSAEDTQAWINDAIRKEELIPFSVRTLDKDQLVGMIAIKDIVWQARHCSFFVGIGRQPDRRMGYGTDAVRILLKYIFLEMNLNRVGLDVMDYNVNAQRVYAGMGFQHEGTLRAYSYRDGVYYDMHIMGMLRSEWEKISGFPPIRYGDEGLEA